MEWIDTYMVELFGGTIATVIATMVAGWKSFMARIRAMEDKIAELDKKLEINTALDKVRHGK